MLCAVSEIFLRILLRVVVILLSRSIAICNRSDSSSVSSPSVDSSGSQTVFSSGGYFNSPYGLAFDSSGNLYVANGDANASLPRHFSFQLYRRESGFRYSAAADARRRKCSGSRGVAEEKTRFVSHPNARYADGNRRTP